MTTPRKGLLIDFSGVLTSNVFVSFNAFCEAEGLEPDTMRTAFRGDPPARQLLYDLETGTVEPHVFSVELPKRLGLVSNSWGDATAYDRPCSPRSSTAS